MVTYTSSGLTTPNNFDFGGGGNESAFVQVYDTLTPDFTGAIPTSITMGIRAAAGESAGTLTYYGFIQNGATRTLTGSTYTAAYPGPNPVAFADIVFQLPNVALVDGSLCGIIITSGDILEAEAFDAADQSVSWHSQRGNNADPVVANLPSNRYQAMTLGSSAPSASTTFFPPPPAYVRL